MARFDLSKYVTVQERINQFWEEHPDGKIITEVVPVGDFNHCVIIAKVWKKDGTLYSDATGIAAEERMTTGGGPNTSSWWENCETSAIGRALANMGYATSNEDRPSREEMAKANQYEDRPATDRYQQGNNPAKMYDELRQSGVDNNLATPAQRQAIHRMTGKLGWDDIEIEEELKKPLAEATRQDASAFITYLGSLLDQERSS